MKRVCGILFALCLASALVWTWSGQAQNPADPDHAAKMAKGLDLFKQQIRPMLSQRCVKCHGGEKTEAAIADRDGNALPNEGAASRIEHERAECEALVDHAAQNTSVCKISGLFARA